MLEAGESVVFRKMLEVVALELHALGGSSSVSPEVGFVAMPGFSKVGAASMDRTGSDTVCGRFDER